MGRIFRMYGGLKKEVYVLCFGRFVTAMGSLVWPMLTLILKSKLGFDAEQVALCFLIFGMVKIPFAMFSGKLTDKYNKRNIIIVFDLISVALYVMTAILPLTFGSLCLYCVGSLFQSMEWASYDALIAELTTSEEREKAYSLEYLANNLGVVFAPTLGGLLFNNYLWLSFLIAGLAVLSSTILIYHFVPTEIEKAKNENTYETRTEGSLWEILKMRKIMFVFIFTSCIYNMIYAQFGYLLPIQMDEVFLTQGAVFYGMLTSINGIVVIVFTPILTQLTLKWRDYERMMAGVLLEVVGLCSIFFYQKQLFLYVISMVVFTLGEVLHTLGNSPYTSKRIPISHRGRFVTLLSVFTTLSSSFGSTIVGKVIVWQSFREGWLVVFVLGTALLAVMCVYRKADRRRFPMLYGKNVEIE